MSLYLVAARSHLRDLRARWLQTILNDLRVLVETGRVSIEQLDLTRAQYDGLQKQVDIHGAKWSLVHLRKTRKSDLLNELQQFIDSGRVSLGDLGLTSEEFDTLVASVRT